MGMAIFIIVRFVIFSTNEGGKKIGCFGEDFGRHEQVPLAVREGDDLPKSEEQIFSPSASPSPSSSNILLSPLYINWEVLQLVGIPNSHTVVLHQS